MHSTQEYSYEFLKAQGLPKQPSMASALFRQEVSERGTLACLWCNPCLQFSGMRVDRQANSGGWWMVCSNFGTVPTASFNPQPFPLSREEEVLFYNRREACWVFLSVQSNLWRLVLAWYRCLQTAIALPPFKPRSVGQESYGGFIGLGNSLSSWAVVFFSFLLLVCVCCFS
jgi:hypothetical protein